MGYTYRKSQKKAKLVGFVGQGSLWLQNIHDEWIHDVYEESEIHYGMIYSVEKPFPPLSTSITGYFQDKDTKKWIKVIDGVAKIQKSDQENEEFGWTDRLEELIQKELHCVG